MSQKESSTIIYASRKSKYTLKGGILLSNIITQVLYMSISILNIIHFTPTSTSESLEQ